MDRDPAARGNWRILAASACLLLGAAVAQAQAPTITVQPVSQTAAVGQTATFSVTATGSGPLSYWWYKAIPGASTWDRIQGAAGPTYTTPAVTQVQNGTRYQVRVAVTNPYSGFTSSSPATLTVIPAAPAIVTEPASQTVTEGQAATFSVIAQGAVPLGYQWKKNGTSIPGATSSTYITPPTTSADNGARFTVKVTNSAGSVTSGVGGNGNWTGELFVVTPPSITTQPLSQTVNAGTPVTFRVVAAGSNLSYKWFKNGVEIGYGGWSANYTKTAALADSGSVFKVVVSNSVGTVTSADATLTVVVPVTISLSPTTASMQLGGTPLSFTATLGNTANTAVNWSATGGSFSPPGSTASTTTWIPNASGTFTITAQSQADSTKIATATATVTSPVTIALTPKSASLLLSGSQAFDAAVSGSANTAVTWTPSGGDFTADGTGIHGIWTPPSASGTYTLTATSQADPAKSDTATLVVNPALVQVAPAAYAVQVNTTQAFTATVTGPTNTAVTWSVMEAGGGTITPAGLYTAPATVGTYHVKAVPVGDITQSASATITVTATPPVNLEVSPAVVSMNVGGSVTLTALVTGTTDTAVTWSPSGGSLDLFTGSPVTWTAPQVAGTYTVTVARQADPGKTATVTIRVNPVVCTPVN